MPDQSFLISVRQCSFAVPHRWSTASRTLSHDKLGRTVDMPPTYERIEGRTTCCHTLGRESGCGSVFCGGIIGMPYAGAGKNNRRGAERQRRRGIRRYGNHWESTLCVSAPHNLISPEFRSRGRSPRAESTKQLPLKANVRRPSSPRPPSKGTFRGRNTPRLASSAGARPDIPRQRAARKLDAPK
jgi:hypothetical protein